MIFTIQKLISNNLKSLVFILTFSCIIINFEGICDLTSRLSSEKIFSDFFKPSEKILPKQYVLQRQNSNLRVARANKFSNTNCQTHTVQLLGKCIVMCDQSMLGFCHWFNLKVTLGMSNWNFYDNYISPNGQWVKLKFR